MHDDNVPKEDAVCAARMKQAGAILFGKTTTPEFGHKALTDAPLFGRTRNAWSAERTSGGSSGGAAVAVAAGIGPIGIATDGGGSTRIPGGGQRHGRAEAEQRRHPAQPGRRRLRQLHLRDADDAHGDGHRADAAGHGGPSPVRSLVDRRAGAGLHRRRASRGQPQGQAHPFQRHARQHAGRQGRARGLRAGAGQVEGPRRRAGRAAGRPAQHGADLEGPQPHDLAGALRPSAAARGQPPVAVAGPPGRDGRASGRVPTTSTPCSSAPISSAASRAGSRRPTIW